MLRRAALTLVVAAGLFGCGGNGSNVTTRSDEAPRSVGPLEDLQPPSVGLRDAHAVPLGEAVSFVSCDEADAYVSGALRGSVALEEPGTERLCYIEHIDEDKRHYAGALVVPVGYDIKAATILDVNAAGGTAMAVSTGTSAVDLSGTDPRAPGGGFAEFRLDATTVGRVVRIRVDRTHAIYFHDDADGGSVETSVTSNRSPADVVAMAQAVFVHTSSVSHPAGRARSA